MPRPRQRACLQDGLKLDLNHLTQLGIVRSGAQTGPVSIVWTGNCCASGLITVDATGLAEGWLLLHIGSLDQKIILMACRRYFGGRQWYFICPYTNRRVSVLWKPPGADKFASRHAWAGHVAYASQFETAYDRTYRAQYKINLRLCLIGGFNAAEWKYPPKPKWMRWRIYNRAIEKFDRYEAEAWGMATARLGITL